VDKDSKKTYGWHCAELRTGLAAKILSLMGDDLPYIRPFDPMWANH